MDKKLAEDLAAVVGHENLLLGDADRSYATADLFPPGDHLPALLVIRPSTTEQASRVVAALKSASIPVVPRGAGLSYTGGVTPAMSCAVIDTCNLNFIEINAQDLYARVGAGVSWERLHEALRPYHLKCAQPNPISGSHSTVGGTAAQNIPGGTEGFLGAVVVAADGNVIRTGAAMPGNGFWRLNGPDFTGMFLGDCGAFGIKTELIVRLAPVRPTAFASYSFEDVGTLLEAMVPILRRGLVSRALAMDPLKSRDAAKVDTAEAVRIASAVVSRSGSFGASLKDLAQLAKGAVRKNEGWALHLTAESATEVGANAQLDLAREICAARGREIDNVIPKTLAAKPYSIRGFVGPQGERWVPIHGILPLSRASRCMNELLAFTQSRAVGMEQNGIALNWIVSSIGAYVTIEAMFYWNDALDPIHVKHLSPRNAERFGQGQKNAPARQVIRDLRVAMREIYERNGAIHAQTGRFYRLPEDSRSLGSKIKKLLDEDGTMNPGVLGL